nr:hypothetical protein [Tanacetum cinerariifolium]
MILLNWSSQVSIARPTYCCCLKLLLVNSFKPVPQIIANANGTSTSTILSPVTTEEKAQKKNDVKARSMLLMALLNEHLLTFSQYKDAKTLFEAIQVRFGDNDATKKTQRTLLKQMYENFNALSTESLDSIFNKLQKIVSQLTILGENISQEDLNMKFLKIFPAEQNTHVVIWRNKADLDTMSIDDLYNNFKIVEQEVKRTVVSSSSSGSQNMDFLSSPGSTNEVDTTSNQVSAVSTPVSTVSSPDNTANLSDANVYAFLENKRNGSQLVHEDLEQIHKDDLEEMDLNWQLALLSIRARRECKSPRNQESRLRNQDNLRKTVIVDDTSSKAMVAIDGADLETQFSNGLGPQKKLILLNFICKEHDGGYVSFGRGAKGGKITGKGTIRTVMNEFCEAKGIKREYNVARTPQQNNVAQRKNRTLIEAARTMLTDSKLPTTFWAEAVNTACYVQKSVLVVKPHFKTPYELFKGKFDGKSDEGIFVGYSTTSKAFRVYNIRTRKVEENLYITFLENKPMIVGGGPEWLFDLDALSKSINYAPVSAGTNFNDFAGKGASFKVGQSSMETGCSQDYILMPLWKDNSLFDSSSQALDSNNKNKYGPSQASESDNQERPNAESSTKIVNIAGLINTATHTYDDSLNDPLMPDLEDAGIFDDAYDDRDEGAEANYNNLQTMEPKKVTQALDDESLVEAIQKELLQFKLLNVWILVDLPLGKRAIGTKWVYRNKKDQRGIVVRNKARLVTQGHRQEEGIDYNEVFALVARIETIRLFLAYASFMYFTVYQMDVKSAFLYGYIKEEVYFSQPPGFVDPEFPDRVYKVEKALYGLHQAPRAWYLSTEFEQLMHKLFQMSSIEELNFFLKPQVEPRKDSIFLSQDKYVSDILKKFGFSSVKSATTPMETHKSLSKNAAGTDVNVDLYSDYAGASLDRNLQQEVVLWLQNQLLDYGYNFMQTKIHVDNKSAICVVKNPVYHSKTKHIQIRHHFIKDSYEKKLIEMVKIHTNYNVADLLTKAFDVTRFQFLVASIGSVSAAVYICIGIADRSFEEKDISGIWCKSAAVYTFWILKMGCKNGQVMKIGLELKGYLINDGYADLVQHASDYFNTDGQTETGKELSNPLMDDSLPKTTLPTKLVQIEISKEKLAKTTSWNEFNSTMASAIICLATNHKFNFSRYILLSLVKNIEASVPFFMFPRFVQLIINHQLGDMTHHKDIFDAPSLTKKVFANIKRVGTGFSREVTQSFDNMLVQAPEEVGNLQADAQPIPILIPTEPSTSKPQKKNKPKRKHTKEPEVLPTESQAEHNEPLPLPSHDPLPSVEDSLKFKELIDLYTNLSNKVLDLESEVLDIKYTYTTRIEKLESRVERLEEENRALKKLKGVHFIVDYDEPVYKLDLDHQEKVLSMLDVNGDEPVDVKEVLEVVKAAKLIIEVVTTAGVDVNAASVQDTPITAAEATKVQAKDKGKEILIEEPKPLKRQVQIDLDEEVARQLEAELNADINYNAVIEQVKRSERLTYNMAGYKMDYFKGMSYNEIRPLFEKHYNYNQTFLNEVNEGIKVPKQEVRQKKEVKVESSKREGESLEQEIAKKQKMKEETEELKKHLQNVPNDDDDVYTDAAPLASRILIIDYKIHTERNRPYFNIIRADGNHKLFLSFSIMLKNFDREDLESLLKIVRERFEKTEPKNYTDDFLLNTLKIYLKSLMLKLITQIFLLVERMYPLTHFTLEQMVNDVRIEVEDESKMSLELLRLVERQLNEGGGLLEIIGLHKLVLLDQLTATA